MKLHKKKKSNPSSRRQRLGGDAGTAASFSYYSRRSDTPSNIGRNISREALKPMANSLRSFWLQRFGLLILLVAGLACLVGSAELSANAKVVVIQSASSENLIQPTEVYEKAANKELESSVLNHTKITINTSLISQRLIKQFPELGHVTITLPLLAHRPIIYITPVEPALVLATPSGSFVIDVNGRSLLPTASIGLGSDSLPKVIDQSGLRVSANKQVLPGGDVAFIQEVSAQLAARKFLVSSMTLPAASQELDVRFTDKPFFVKFNLADASTVRTQSGTFLAVYNNLQGQGFTPGQYIDVRVPGRAYYK